MAMDNVPLPKAGRLWKGKADFFRPFKAAAVVEANETITPLLDLGTSRTQTEHANLRDLNTALFTLVEVFPHVQPEVFREMLLAISPESRVQIVTEKLLSRKKSGPNVLRKRPPQRRENSRVVSMAKSANKSLFPQPPTLPVEDTFRSEGYREAVKEVFYQEFRSLSHSAIKAVMAEHNSSYTLARPTLQQLASKSWRFSFASLWPRRSISSTAVLDLPCMAWQNSGNVKDATTPVVKHTGSAELDIELHQLFVAPVLEKQRQNSLAADRSYADQINEADAVEAESLFDCECCYNSVSFEHLSTCDYDGHQLCFDCVGRTINEAIYGHGWSRAADIAKGTVRCFAPTTHGCPGSIPVDLARRALTDANGKLEIWQEFERRAADEVLLKSRLPLQRCPSCNYAEVALPPPFRLRSLRQLSRHFTARTPVTVQILCLSIIGALAFFTLALFMLASLIYLLFNIYSPFQRILTGSYTRVHNRRRTLKFSCQQPACGLTTCVRCLAPWRDPHVCFESEQTSLRTLIEAAATTAIKRTCPVCLLSFVKSSGCNKLVCNCGYVMCYICRKEIGAKEGYAHFCQHFRPGGGGRGECCDRCELYGNEDEEKVVRMAVERAERDWRGKGLEVSGEDERRRRAMVEVVVGTARKGRWWEGWLDAVVDAVVA